MIVAEISNSANVKPRVRSRVAPDAHRARTQRALRFCLWCEWYMIEDSSALAECVLAALRVDVVNETRDAS